MLSQRGYKLQLLLLLLNKVVVYNLRLISYMPDKLVAILFYRTISPDLNTVVRNAVKVIIVIKSHALNTRILANFCDEIAYQYQVH